MKLNLTPEKEELLLKESERKLTLLEDGRIDKVYFLTQLISNETKERIKDMEKFYPLKFLKFGNEELQTPLRDNAMTVICRDKKVKDRWENAPIDFRNKIEHLRALGYSPTHSEVIKFLVQLNQVNRQRFFPMSKVRVDGVFDIFAPEELMNTILEEYNEMYDISEMTLENIN